VQEDKIFMPWAAGKLRAEMAIYKWFLKENGFDEAEIKRVDKITDDIIAGEHRYVQWGLSFRYPPLYEDGVDWEKTVYDPMDEVYQFFDLFFNHNISVTKGAFLVYTQGDNTAPYSIFDAIDNYLSARHIHLG
jgi:hypothetical protein